MKRLQNTFFNLAIRMVGFGLLIGIVFPYFMRLLGVPESIAFSGLFLSSCIIAGIIVGFANILISRVTVKRKLSVLTGKMREVKDSVITISENGRIGIAIRSIAAFRLKRTTISGCARRRSTS